MCYLFFSKHFCGSKIIPSLITVYVFVACPALDVWAETRTPDDTCTFQRLEILPTDPVNFERFSGRGHRVFIEFKADFGRETDVFPEPPTVVNRSTNKSCNVEEGGIWLRRQVYITPDESRLLSNQYSGSWEALVVYDTNTCARLGEMRLNRRLVSIDRNTVSVEADCPPASRADLCARKLSITFNRQCVPKRK